MKANLSNAQEDLLWELAAEERRAIRESIFDIEGEEERRQNIIRYNLLADIFGMEEWVGEYRRVM